MSDLRPPTRFSDEMLFRLDERVRNHITWIEKEHEDVKDRLKLLEDWRSGIEQPVHIAGVLIIGLVMAFVSAVGAWVWHMVTRIRIM